MHAPDIPVPVPRKWLQRAAQTEGGSYGAVFLMGAMSGVVAAPCGAPAFAVVLTWVAATGAGLMGFVYLFVFSLGMTALLVAVGLFSGTVALLPRSGSNRLAPRIHPLDGVGEVARPDASGQCPEVEPPRAPEAERLGHGQRPIHEVALRRHDLDLDSIVGERSQGEHRLERGHAPAGDQHLARCRAARKGSCRAPDDVRRTRLSGTRRREAASEPLRIGV